METKLFNYFYTIYINQKSAVMNAFYLCFEKKVLPLYAVILITH